MLGIFAWRLQMLLAFRYLCYSFATRVKVSNPPPLGRERLNKTNTAGLVRSLTSERASPKFIWKSHVGEETAPWTLAVRFLWFLGIGNIDKVARLLYS